MYTSHSFLDVISLLLPGAPDLRCDALDIDLFTSTLTFVVPLTKTDSCCPRCQSPSARVQSRYVRTLADLPWAESPVRLLLHVRRFFCSSEHCSQHIFTQRVPDLVAPWARRTRRLADRHRALGVALGGRCGARVSARLDQPTSRDTLVRLVRQLPELEEGTPARLGVDDFALRKGQRYGTILVNLDTGRPVELLPERTAEVLASWLAEHPGVELITRDRAGAYAEGARQGAPDALQVADRWHILSNLVDALKQIFTDYPQALRAPPPPAEDRVEAEAETGDGDDKLGSAHPEAVLPPPALAVPVTRTEQLRRQRQERRSARYEQIQTLRDQGVSLRTIAQQLHLSRGTVRKYARAASAPVPQPRAKRASLLDPSKPYLVKRWNEGCHVGPELLREIEAQGYGGGRSVAMDFVAALRKQQGIAPMKRTGLPPQSAKEPSTRGPTARELAWLVLKRPERRDEVEQAQLVQLQQVDETLQTAMLLAEEFAMMVRERRAERLDGWLEQVESSGVAALKSFAGGIRRDYGAVKAGLSMAYSNGVVEGNVNRLKCVKRQMFGRANFDLLRKRVLYAA